MIAEDPNDPTSAISDDEVIETLLVGGTWCPTGKLYLCKWDTEHTILAVGVAADENPGCTVASEPHLHQGGSVPRFRIRGTRIAGRAYRDDENRSARGFCQELQVTDD